MLAAEVQQQFIHVGEFKYSVIETVMTFFLYHIQAH
jgi:hypothetical protein